MLDKIGIIWYTYGMRLSDIKKNCKPSKKNKYNITFSEFVHRLDDRELALEIKEHFDDQILYFPKRPPTYIFQARIFLNGGWSIHAIAKKLKKDYTQISRVSKFKLTAWEKFYIDHHELFGRRTIDIMDKCAGCQVFFKTMHSCFKKTHILHCFIDRQYSKKEIATALGVSYGYVCKVIHAYRYVTDIKYRIEYDDLIRPNKIIQEPKTRNRNPINTDPLRHLDKLPPEVFYDGSPVE